MNFSLLADVESAFESFFSNLTSSTTFNLLFFLGIGLEVFLILLFAVKSRFSYEARMRRSLDDLNRWLFKNKTLDKENIKEFNNMVKKAPKRLALNWQQYILYREKAPSEYMSVENIVEKPLRASSYSLNIKNLIWLSVIWMLATFMLGISYNNIIADTIVNANMILTALIVPFFILLMCAIAVLIMQSRKNANLDELYQNLHLFNRFIDNACLELPPYIDYSLLFTNEEIDKGIPALREYLESRARKEKEEFDQIAKEQNVEYEKYDFSKLGINGQNILERAMKEAEAYLSKRDKTLAKVAQIEATLESLKRNFENIQKDYQKKMQITKENIDRLRQQQEETTNRIESNFLRKQQNQEITKQEKDESEFEQQKRRYLIEKGEYEETIKALKEEIEASKGVVEEAMMSEYETFYAQLFNSAHDNAEKDVKEKISTLKETKSRIEKDLTLKEAQLKRIIDENETLKRKLGVEYEPIEIESVDKLEEEEQKREKEEEEKQENTFQTPEQISALVKQHAKEVKEEIEQATSKSQAEKVEDKLSGETNDDKGDDKALNEERELPQTNEDEDFEFADNFTQQNTDESKNQQTGIIAEDYVPSNIQQNVEYDEIQGGEQNLAEQPEGKEQEEVAKSSTGKKRGRPRKGEEKTLEQIIAEKRPRGRPRKEVEKQPKKPGKRGRPVGSTKKQSESTSAKTNSKAVKNKEQKNKIARKSSKQKAKAKVETDQTQQKRGRGRPRKTDSLKSINQKIVDEENKLSAKKSALDKEIKKAMNSLEKKSSESARRDELLNEINELRESVEKVKQNLRASDQIEKLNKRIEDLLKEIKSLNS